MAKYLDSSGLSQVWTKIGETFINKGGGPVNGVLYPSTNSSINLGTDSLKFHYLYVHRIINVQSICNATTYSVNKLDLPNKSGTIAITSDITSAVSGYLPLAGGRMTGSLTFPSGYQYAGNNYAINLSNSDIISINSLYFADPADAVSEGIHFARSNGNWDTILSYEGTLRYLVNKAKDGSTYTDYTIYHTGNLPAYPTKASWNYDDVYLKLSGGTLTGNLTVSSGSESSLTLGTSTSGQIGALYIYASGSKYHKIVSAATGQYPTITLPNASGTFALTSDLSAYSLTTHTHDSRYVLKSGDTMSGNLTLRYSSPSIDLINTTYVDSASGINFHPSTSDPTWAAMYIRANGSSTSSLGGVNSFNIGNERGHIYLYPGNGSGTVYINNNTTWHAGNDGSGSGLDADLLDGQHGSYYASASSLGNYLPLSGGTLSGNLGIVTSGESILSLGNSNSGIYGALYLYASGSRYTRLVTAATGASHTITFPNADGTVSLEGHTHSYLPLSGGTVTGTITVSSTNKIAFPNDGDYTHYYSGGTNENFSIGYGRIQGYSNVYINADTDGSKTEYILMTAGRGVSTTTSHGLKIGYDTLTWLDNTVWHSGNDGSGSGLDADTVDGYHASIDGTTSISAKKIYSQTGYSLVYFKVGTLPTITGTSSGESNVIFKVYNAVDFGRNTPAEWIVTASSRDAYNVSGYKVCGTEHINVGYVINDNLMEIWIESTAYYLGKTSIKVEHSTNFTSIFSRQNTKPDNWVNGDIKTLATTSYINETNFPGINRTGTVTSVATGTGLTGGTITSTGTISINSTYQDYISHGESAYNSLGNYLLKSGGGVSGIIYPTTNSNINLGTDSLKFHYLYTHRILNLQSICNATTYSVNKLDLPSKSGTIAVTSDIPTNTNQLTNGAGFITSSGSCSHADTADSATKFNGTTDNYFLRYRGSYSSNVGGNAILGVVPGNDLGADCSYGVLLQWGANAHTTNPGVDGAWYVQLLDNHTSGRMHYRRRVNSGGWTSWSTIATTADIPSVSTLSNSEIDAIII